MEAALFFSWRSALFTCALFAIPHRSDQTLRRRRYFTLSLSGFLCEVFLVPILVSRIVFYLCPLVVWYFLRCRVGSFFIRLLCVLWQSIALNGIPVLFQIRRD